MLPPFFYLFGFLLILQTQSDKIKLRRKLNKIPSVRCVFLSHDKNACSIFAYLLMEVKVCVAAIGACVFGA